MAWQPVRDSDRLSGLPPLAPCPSGTACPRRCSVPLVLRSGRENIMSIRTWVALASIAAAILVFCFAILGANMDPEGLPSQPVKGEIVRQVPASHQTAAPQ